MRISVIIPTLNANTYLSTLVSTLRKQTLFPSEIIVIDSASSDQTVDTAAEMGCIVKVIERKEFNHGGTRNLGAKLSSGEVLIFVSQDALPANKNFLLNLVQPIMDDAEIKATTARQVPHTSAFPPEKFARNYNYPPVSHIRNFDDIDRLGIKAFFFSNVASAIEREFFEEMGGFPERVIMNEDMIFCAKVLQKGYSVAYVADAIVIHSHNYTIRQTFNRYFDIGVALEENKNLLLGAKSAGEGINFMREQWLYLASHSQWQWLPVSGLESIAKALAFYMGSKHHFFPCNLKKKMGMHEFYWNC